MIWNFFCNGHGKGPHDGARCDIKHFIRHKQLNLHGTKLQNAKEAVNFLCVNLSNHTKSSYLKKKRPIYWTFWHIVSKHVDCNSGIFACNILEGTQKIHCILAIN
jgi:hypothetical protein